MDKKIMVAFAVLGVICLCFLAYINARDTAFVEEEEQIVVDATGIETTYSENECMVDCVALEAQGFDIKGDYCRCWFKMQIRRDIDEEGECEIRCSDKNADGFDFDRGREYCRCWLEIGSS